MPTLSSRLGLVILFRLLATHLAQTLLMPADRNLIMVLWANDGNGETYALGRQNIAPRLD
jgi:hypothetical protein